MSRDEAVSRDFPSLPCSTQNCDNSLILASETKHKGTYIYHQQSQGLKTSKYLKMTKCLKVQKSAPIYLDLAADFLYGFDNVG